MPLSNSLIELYVDVIECKRVCMSVCVCVEGGVELLCSF